MREEPAVTDPVAEELRLIRTNVPGVRGSITATTDGLLVAHDLPGIEPTQVAALVAASHAVAVRASLSTECGQLREVITRGSDGYLAVYAAGGTAIVAVLGTNDLNVAMLNFQSRKMIERIAQHSAGLARRPRAGVPAPPEAPAPPEREDDAGEALTPRQASAE
jgi:uncharacterized protein